MKFAKRTLCILLTAMLLVGLLPLSAISVAADEVTLITEVVATYDFVAPAYGETYARPSFTMTATNGVPVEFNFSSADWFRWDGSDWQQFLGPKFSDGQYYHDVHINITEDGYAFAENCTLTVNGVVWNENLGEGWQESPAFAIDYVAGLPLEFGNSNKYTIGTTQVGKGIESYSVVSTVSGGTRPYTFAKTSGPDWINVSADGTVSGTPEAVGENEELVITVTDAASNQQSIRIYVRNTYMDPAYRTVIDRVVAEVTYPNLKCGDERITTIEATVIEGAPVTIGLTNSDWYTVDGEGNIGDGYYEEKMVGGTYVMDLDVRLEDGEGGNTHVLSDSVEVIINGAPATLKNSVSVSDTRSSVWVYSAPIVIEHVFDNDTDATCNGCSFTREGCDHQYDADCIEECSVCGDTRVIIGDKHTYDNAADASCNGCGDTRTLNIINLGDTKTVEITEGGHHVDFVFTPTVTGMYAFSSLDTLSQDPEGYLFNAAGEQLDYDDQSGGNSNFKIQYELTAGTTYILRAEFYHGTQTGSFPVMLACAEHAFTDACDADCNICGETRVPPHTYDDLADASCNSCGTTRPLNYISLNDTKTVDITVEDGYVDFVFTPSASGNYIFRSLGDGTVDTHGYLYSADGTLITHDDDNGGDMNFKITYALTAGTSYILRAKMHNGSATGSFCATLECKHAYDDDCDESCNTCGAANPAAHQYSADCDETCNYCSNVRVTTEPHTYTSCTDTTCNNCYTERVAPGHSYDDCEDASCNGCTYTRTAPGHSYDDCEDTSCNGCTHTRTAPGHVYTDCVDAICNNCTHTRTAPGHSYDTCDDLSCNNCTYTRTTAGHLYDNMADATCNGCDHVRELNYIQPGEAKTVTIETAGERMSFVFTPTTTMTLVFKGTGTVDTYGYILDVNGDELTKNDDGNSSTRQFIIEYEFVAGTTYILQARFYNITSTTGTFPILLACKTCTYTDACDDTCNVCGYIRTAPHSYPNYCEDTQCYICGAPRTAPGHSFYHPCQQWCSECDAVNPNAEEHTYTDDCDDVCDVCDWCRIPPHQYGDDDTCDLCGKGRLIVIDRVDLVGDDSWLPAIGDTLGDQHYPTFTVQGDIPFEADPTYDGGWKVLSKTTGQWEWMNTGDTFQEGETYQFWWMYVHCTEDEATTLYRVSKDAQLYVNGQLWTSSGWDRWCGTSDGEANIYANGPQITLVNPTAITKQPAKSYVAAGKTAKFSITATGTGLTYQWQSSSNGTTWKNCSSSSATSATFTFKTRTSHSSNYYRCVITNAVGEVTYTDAVKLYVLGVTSQPKTAKVTVGEKVKYTVKAIGDGLKYQWQSSTDGKTWKNCSSASAKKATFTFTGKTSHNGNYYRCKITDSKGNVVYTDTVRLYVLGVTKQPATQKVETGDTVKFTVKATGSGLKYQWQSSSNGKTWKNCSSSTAKKATFTFTGKTSHNGNYYRCKVTDSKGNVVYTDTVRLYVLGITEQPVKKTVTKGKTAKFEVEATGTGLVYQWQVSTDGGKTWKNCSSTSAKKAAFTFTAKTSHNGNYYRCRVKDNGGNTVYSGKVKLTVK